MSIAPVLALSTLWAGLEMLPQISAGFEDLLAGSSDEAEPSEGSSLSSQAPNSLATLLDQLRKTISQRLGGTEINADDLRFKVDAVGQLHVIDGPAGIDTLLNADPQIRSAALDFVAEAGESEFSLGDA